VVLFQLHILSKFPIIRDFNWKSQASRSGKRLMCFQVRATCFVHVSDLNPNYSDPILRSQSIDKEHRSRYNWWVVESDDTNISPNIKSEWWLELPTMDGHILWVFAYGNYFINIFSSKLIVWCLMNNWFKLYLVELYFRNGIVQAEMWIIQADKPELRL